MCHSTNMFEVFTLMSQSIGIRKVDERPQHTPAGNAVDDQVSYLYGSVN